MFKNKVVLITGGANGIGKCIAETFRKQNAHVYVIDKEKGNQSFGKQSKSNSNNSKRLDAI